MKRMHAERYILDSRRSDARSPQEPRTAFGVTAPWTQGHIRPGKKKTLTNLHQTLSAAIRSRSVRRPLLTLLAAAPLAVSPGAFAQNKLALAPTATYDNRYEVYGGIGFENFQAGQNLPKRMNFATIEAQGTYWLRDHLGVTGDYRFEGGTTPILPNNYYNRVAIFKQNYMGGVTYRGPKGRYAAIDYHALAGGSTGTFDHAFNNYPGGSPISPAQAGLYTNRSAFTAALGGSVDFNYTKNIGLRLQPDLILENYGTELREFVSVSGGIMYRFGKR